ncbi:MAG: DMT family transporter [Desulfobacterales bacterium]|nr:MAG: DMT family transporter [Desulfobacterales bacterium]
MNLTSTARIYPNQPVAGALFVLGSAFTFAVLGAMVKIVSSSLTNEMVVFFRNLCALLFILPWIGYSQPPEGIKTAYFRLHLLRSASGLGAMYCFFYAIAHLQLSEAFLLAATSPLFIPLIAFIWIREPVSQKLQGAVVVGFVGIVLILKPGLGVFQPVAIVGLAAGAFAAFAMVSIRRMSASEPTIRIVFYFTVLSTIFSAVPLVWSWQSPEPKIWWFLILIGFLAAVGQLLLTKGYSLAPAAQVGPFTYVNVVFATLFGWLFWEESLDALTWIGAFLICVAGMVATHRTKTHSLLGSTVKASPMAAGSSSRETP